MSGGPVPPRKMECRSESFGKKEQNRCVVSYSKDASRALRFIFPRQKNGFLTRL